MTTVRHSLIVYASFWERISMGSQNSGNRFNHGSERANAHMIFLPTELYLGLIDKMSALKIGKSHAILDCINESLHNEGFIDNEVYLKFKGQYRRPLLEIVKEKRMKETIEESKPELSKERKTFLMILKQWETVPPKSKQYYLKKAQELKDKIPEAEEILKKAGVL